MFKFKKEEKFYEVINQWIRDGSNLVEVSRGIESTWIKLMGKDGCSEEFWLFHDDDAYDGTSRFIEAWPE